MRKRSIKKLVSPMLFLISLWCMVCVTFAASADNIYISPTNYQPCDILDVEWRAQTAAPSTYWAVENWNQGTDYGAGYAGFQRLGNYTNTVHFSLWDTVNGSPTEIYATDEARVERFGGEGTGLKCSCPYNWHLRNWYRMVVRWWDDPTTGQSRCGQWVKDINNDTWKLITYFEVPLSNIHFDNGFYQFQEDFGGTASKLREFNSRNLYGRKLNGSWLSMNTCNLTSTKNTSHWNVGTDSNGFYGEAGGAIVNSTTEGVRSISQNSQPSFDEIVIDHVNAAYNNGEITTTWAMPESSSPQFKFKIDVYNNAFLSGTPLYTQEAIQPEALSATMPASLSSGVYHVKLTITDLYDRTAAAATTLFVDSSKFYRIKNRWQNTYMNVEHQNNTIEVGSVQPGWNSAYWYIEDRDGAKCIKNFWNNQYITITPSGDVTYTNTVDESSLFTIEEYDGHSRFINVANPSYTLHIENLLGYLQGTNIHQGAFSSQWTFEPVN